MEWVADIKGNVCATRGPFGKSQTPNYGVCASPPSATSVRGGLAKTLPPAKPCPMSSLMRSAYLDWPPVLSFARRTAVYALRMYGGVGGVSGQPLPYPDQLVPVSPVLLR
jgi:hypothetical protein